MAPHSSLELRDVVHALVRPQPGAATRGEDEHLAPCGGWRDAHRLDVAQPWQRADVVAGVGAEVEPRQELGVRVLLVSGLLEDLLQPAEAVGAGAHEDARRLRLRVLLRGCRIEAEGAAAAVGVRALPVCGRVGWAGDERLELLWRKPRRHQAAVVEVAGDWREAILLRLRGTKSVPAFVAVAGRSGAEDSEQPARGTIVREDKRGCEDAVGRSVQVTSDDVA